MTYNPVRTLSLMDRVRAMYWESNAARFLVELSFFIIGCAGIAGLVLVAAA